MNPLYVNAMDKRLRYLEWALDPTPRDSWAQERTGMVHALPAYVECLEKATPYFMDKHFCRMVDHARRIAPDNLKFEATWLHSPFGFVVLEEPFYVPPIEAALKAYKKKCEIFAASPAMGIAVDIINPMLSADAELINYNYIQAVGWRKLEPGDRVNDNSRFNAGIGTGSRIAGENDYQFLIFMEPPDEGPKWREFICWSYFVLHDGMMLGPRLQEFEWMNTCAMDGDNYIRRPEDETLHPLHEVRWVYTAIHLMAQQLAGRIREKTDRPSRRRAERAKVNVPDFIEIVTLRRKHQEKAEHEIQHRDVEWQWQWHVRGHWRDQWYPSEGIHKPKFVEAFMKGPEDAPVKPPTVKLLAAVR